MINPLRTAGWIARLTLDVVEAVACSLSCDGAVHAMWEETKHKSRVDVADVLAEREAAQEVAEPSAFDRYAAHVPEPVWKYGGHAQISEEDMARKNEAVEKMLSAPAPRWAQTWADGMVRPENHLTLPNASAPGCYPTPAAEPPEGTPSADVETPPGSPTADDFFAAAFHLRGYSSLVPIVQEKCTELAETLYAAGQRAKK